MSKVSVRWLCMIGGVAGIFTMGMAIANESVQVTASSTVTNIPGNFTVREFALLRPWEVDWAPGFQISTVPTTKTLSVDPQNTFPTLRLTDATRLSWFYYCNGLQFQYSSAHLNQATVVFFGKINADQPGSGVQCVCTGPACSTTQPVPAVLMRG